MKKTLDNKRTDIYQDALEYSAKSLCSFLAQKYKLECFAIGTTNIGLVVYVNPKIAKELDYLTNGWEGFSVEIIKTGRPKPA